MKKLFILVIAVLLLCGFRAPNGNIISKGDLSDKLLINLEAIFSPHIQVLGGTIRPALGGSINTVGDTSKLYAGMRWQYEHSSGLFAGIGLGGAIHDGKLHLHQSDRKALGSRVLFHIPVELGYRFTAKASLSVFFDHVSNANLADANEGMDTLGGRLGYRF